MFCAWIKQILANSFPVTHSFFVIAPSTTQIYTLSLHDALPISQLMRRILVDFARDRRYLKRGGGALQVSLGEAAAVTVEKDRKSTRLNSSHSQISYAVFCLKKKTNSLQKDTRHTPVSCDFSFKK